MSCGFNDSQLTCIFCNIKVTQYQWNMPLWSLEDSPTVMCGFLIPTHRWMQKGNWSRMIIKQLSMCGLTEPNWRTNLTRLSRGCQGKTFVPTFQQWWWWAVLRPTHSAEHLHETQFHTQCSNDRSKYHALPLFDNYQEIQWVSNSIGYRTARNREINSRQSRPKPFRYCY